MLGTIDALSDAEQAEYFACEEVVGSGWQSFVQVGLALARIRDLRLYRVEFDTFEACCREKWQHGREYVHRFISAAQVFTHLLTNCQETQPKDESHIRPLAGLAPEQVKLA